MLFDFTLIVYETLIKNLLKLNYSIIPVSDYNLINFKDKQKIVILRHDVDKKPENSLKCAEIENKYGVKSTYYFRMKKCSFDKKIIDKIVALNHEIGYHYEDLNDSKGNYEKGIISFQSNLLKLRKHYDITTACMHGRPISKYNSLDMWNHYNYRDYGINIEPYLDIDFNKVFYLTDTGRGWNNQASIRDRANSKQRLIIKDTYHFLDQIKKHKNLDLILINTHPQRWSSTIIEWIFELVWQKTKNVIKKILIIFRTNK